MQFSNPNVDEIIELSLKFTQIFVFTINQLQDIYKFWLTIKKQSKRVSQFTEMNIDLCLNICLFFGNFWDKIIASDKKKKKDLS